MISPLILLRKALLTCWRGHQSLTKTIIGPTSSFTQSQFSISSLVPGTSLRRYAYQAAFWIAWGQFKNTGKEWWDFSSGSMTIHANPCWILLISIYHYMLCSKLEYQNTLYSHSDFVIIFKSLPESRLTLWFNRRK